MDGGDREIEEEIFQGRCNIFTSREEVNGEGLLLHVRVHVYQAIHPSAIHAPRSYTVCFQVPFSDSTIGPDVPSQ